MTGLLQDVRYGLRMLRKRPGFTAVAVITLALGIGANTTTFSTVNAMLLRPFPFPKLDRMVTVWETAPKQNDYHLSPAACQFPRLDRAQHANRPALGRPRLGREFDRRQRGGACRRFAGHRKLLFVAGIGSATRPLHRQRRFPGRGRASGGHQLWILAAAPGRGSRNRRPATALEWSEVHRSRHCVCRSRFPHWIKGLDSARSEWHAAEDRDNHYLTVFGRLKDGVSMPQAQANLETIAASLGKQYPRSNAGHGVNVRNTVEDLTVGSRQFVLMLMGAAVFVLLLACANVANLQLARASGRQREIALRAALGASRWQVGRQLLVESVLLALLGSGLAIFLSGWWLNIMRRTIPPFVVEHIAGLEAFAG